jgi:hypothetical protein
MDNNIYERVAIVFHILLKKMSCFISEFVKIANHYKVFFFIC